MTDELNPIPEVPSLVDARIVTHPRTGHGCLLAHTEEGRSLAFGFEVDSDMPGLMLVDPAPWLAADAAGADSDDPRRFDAVVEARADDWLQAVETNPVGAEWLDRIKEEHPAAYARWHALRDYVTGGEQGSGGSL